MQGISFTLHEIDANVVYTNKPKCIQHLTNLQTFKQTIVVTNRIKVKASFDSPVYTGESKDARTWSRATFYSFNPLGPYYQWDVFSELAKDIIEYGS